MTFSLTLTLTSQSGADLRLDRMQSLLIAVVSAHTCVLWKQQQQQALTAEDAQSGEQRCRCGVAVSSAAVAEDDRSPEIERLHDELVASKLREAESHLSMKEFEQKLLQLQRHWQVSAFYRSSI